MAGLKTVGKLQAKAHVLNLYMGAWTPVAERMPELKYYWGCAPAPAHAPVSPGSKTAGTRPW